MRRDHMLKIAVATLVILASGLGGSTVGASRASTTEPPAGSGEDNGGATDAGVTATEIRLGTISDNGPRCGNIVTIPWSRPSSA